MMEHMKNYAWLTFATRNTNKLHAVSISTANIAGVYAVCGIAPYGFWYAGKEGQEKCKNCLRKLGKGTEK